VRLSCVWGGRRRGRGRGERGIRAPRPHPLSPISPPARRPASTATAPLATAHAPPSLLTTSAAVAADLPPHARRALAWWLGGCAAWVASMVALGGATRLTRSGLSMTDWKFTGERPPGTLDEWEAEFGKYKRSPEYERVNR